MPGLLSAVGLGQFGQNSHPVHPATVHLPIAFLLTASALDLATWVGLRAPRLLAPLAPLARLGAAASAPAPLDTPALIDYLSLISYASTAAALLTSLPTLLSGLAEGYAMVRAHGLDMARPKVKTMVAHALLNDVAVAGAFYNCWARRAQPALGPRDVNALVSSVVLVAVVYSAYLGGSLVYEHGVGVQRQGEGRAIKEQMLGGKKREGVREGKKEL